MKLLDSAILYCDNHLLVILKPPMVATQPDLEEEGKAWLKKKFAKPGNVFLHAIHRLDKPVSGVVLFARTSKALSRLQAMMREKEIAKTYVAEIEGHLEKEEGTLKHFLVHDEHRARVDFRNGKEALLHYRVLKKKKETSLVEINLETGRYHQIRAQFSAVGHPIVGDTKYGSKRFCKEGISLESTKLSFKHPITGKEIEITSSGKPYKLPSA